MKPISTRKKYWNCLLLEDGEPMKSQGIGKIALLLAITDGDDENLKKYYESKNYIIYKGQAGSMDAKKIIASIETAAYRENIIMENYHEEHALYHAIIEALSGYCRGQVMLGEVLRSAGLTFTIVKGKLIDGDASSGNWIAVVLYGHIGSPRRGFEHEAIGMGIQSI